MLSCVEVDVDVVLFVLLVLVSVFVLVFVVLFVLFVVVSAVASGFGWWVARMSRRGRCVAVVGRGGWSCRRANTGE